MGYLLKSIEDTNNGFFKVRLAPYSECIVKVNISNVDSLLDNLPQNPFTKPFGLQIKEIEEKEICSQKIIRKYFIKFDEQAWIPCEDEQAWIPCEIEKI